MSDTHSQTFFITGATGQQGGHVTRALLSAGHKVHALTRDATSPAAKAVEALGAVLFQGEFGDASVEDAAKGCHGVFLNVYPDFNDPEGECKHAQNVVSTCRAAGVKKIVYSSALLVSEYSQMQADGRLEAGSFLENYFRSKYRIEELVKAAGFDSWTILEPAWLMSNLTAPMARFYFPELASTGVMKTAYEPQTKLYLSDPKDVGSFAAKALTTENGKWHEQLIPLVAQELTIGEIAERITDWLGGLGAVRPEFMAREEKEKMKMMNPMVASQIWLSQNGFGAYSDVEKQYGIPLGSLQDFLKREAKAMKEALTT